jgi:hexokinase
VGRVCQEYRIETREKEGVIMKWWDDFCDSLSTRGGTIALLFVATITLGIFLLHIMHMGYAGDIVAEMRTAFASFVGALLIALTSQNKNNGNGNGGSK